MNLMARFSSQLSDFSNTHQLIRIQMEATKQSNISRRKVTEQKIISTHRKMRSFFFLLLLHFFFYYFMSSRTQTSAYIQSRIRTMATRNGIGNSNSKDALKTQTHCNCRYCTLNPSTNYRWKLHFNRKLCDS